MKSERLFIKNPENLYKMLILYLLLALSLILTIGYIKQNKFMIGIGGEDEYGLESSTFQSSKIVNMEVGLINQLPKFPTGCEVTAATMLLRYYGVEVTKEELAEEMPKAELPTFNDGLIRGESPNRYFIGNPEDVHSFGVFHGPIYNLLRKYINVEDMTGYEFQDIVDRVKEGNPVMVWITMNLVDIEYKCAWYIEDELFWWPGNEHAVLITDVIEDKVIIANPYGGVKNIYDIDRFEKIWNLMGKQAIVVITRTYMKY